MAPKADSSERPLLGPCDGMLKGEAGGSAPIAAAKFVDRLGRGDELGELPQGESAAGFSASFIDAL